MPATKPVNQAHEPLASGTAPTRQALAGNSPAEPSAPVIDFAGTSVTPHNDLGKTSAAIYRYDASKKTFLRMDPLTQSDRDAEVKLMMTPTATAPDIRVTITPLFIGPSRRRFRLTSGRIRGDAKPYAMVTVSFAQDDNLKQLKAPLTWTNAYSITALGDNRDIQSTRLDYGGASTFTAMPLPNGKAILNVDFSTGTTHSGISSAVNTILNVVAPVTQDAAKLSLVSGLLAIPGATVVAATNYMRTFAATIAAESPKPTITVDLSLNLGVPVIAANMKTLHSVSRAGVLRLLKDETQLLLIPQQDADAFEADLRGLGTDKVVIFNPHNQPIVVDAKTLMPPATNTQSDPNTVDPFQKYTMLVLDILVDDYAPSGAAS